MRMTLSEEIEARRQYIRSDGYPMSIGELSNLYRDREIVIRPEYQRLFRWSLEKKSRLIESILLGIPLPSVFVSAREDGVWEVVDGLQRLSTIFEFMGILRDEATGEVLPPSQLLRTKYLPSLDGMYYDNSDDPGKSLGVTERLTIKRAKLDIKILQKESDASVKFELFDRLNSGGQPTSEQEVRTAQLLMVHPDFYHWLDSLRNFEPFQDCLPLTSRQVSEQYDLELVLRFLVLYYSTPDVLGTFSEFDSLLTDQSLVLAEGSGQTLRQGFTREGADAMFRETFTLIAGAGIDVFRRYDEARGKHAGGFTVSSFEAVTVGVASNIEAWREYPGDRSEVLLDLSRKLWGNQTFRGRSGAGVRASQRVPVMVQFGPEHFRP